MKNPVHVYLDMDGVLCDFISRYNSIEKHHHLDYHNFVDSVVNDRIFTKLKWMPNGEKFFNNLVTLQELYGFSMSICSSVNSFEPTVMDLGAVQKTEWLYTRGIVLDSYFTSCGEEKAKFAKDANCILIDDTKFNCQRFFDFGGLSIQHNDSSYMRTLVQLEKYVSEPMILAN